MEQIPIKKNEKYIVDIIDNGFEGEGIAKIENFIIFIKKAIKGEKCEVLITKVLSSHGYAKLLKVIEKSDKRIESDCQTYQRCGGCDLRHMDYESTLELKKNTVQVLINKELTADVKVENIIGMQNPYYYRNKAQYPVGIGIDGIPTIGVFAQRTHDIIPIRECKIQTQISQQIGNTIIEFIKKHNISVYNEKTQKGIFRHIVIRVGKYTKEIMCIIVLNCSKFKEETELVKELCEKYPNIKTIVKNVNNNNTNVILGNKNINLYGNGYIKDTLGKYTFRISPMSFYQVNVTQAEVLYNIAIKAAKLDKKDILFDLYCGTGTIGIFASKHVKKVYGIEIVEQAIIDAKVNSKLNNVNNIEFVLGDVEIAFDELINNKKVVPTAIIVDPPRKGLDGKTIENIIKIKPNKFVYISCNPATMVRDLKMLKEVYKIEKIEAVDMFPFTSHIETVTCLTLKNQ